MRSTQRHIEAQARKFFELMLPSVPWAYSGHPAKPLILAAFFLYAHEWGQYRIEAWQWPFDIHEKGGDFDGDQPWAVLLRRAREIAP